MWFPLSTDCDLCKCKWGNFALVESLEQSHKSEFCVTWFFIWTKMQVILVIGITTKYFNILYTSTTYCILYQEHVFFSNMSQLGTSRIYVHPDRPWKKSNVPKYKEQLGPYCPNLYIVLTGLKGRRRERGKSIQRRGKSITLCHFFWFLSGSL